MRLLRSFLLGLRAEGWRTTARRVWTRLFGDEEYVVFIRCLERPASPVSLPVERGGMRVREMTAEDLDTVARLIPFSLTRTPLDRRRAQLARSLGESVVATRDDRIVGAVWYLDDVGPHHPWYAIAEPHLERPARLTTGVFVLPDEKVNAWFLTHTASTFLASRGVRTTVSTVRSENKPSLLMARLHGGWPIAKCHIRYRFGIRFSAIEPVSERVDLLRQK